MAGEFLTNPLVQALGDHLGMSAVMGMGDPSPQPSPPAAPSTPPAQPQMTPPRAKAVETPREFRQHAPIARGNTGRGLPPGQNAGMNLPGVMSPDVLMHPDVQKLLGQYGVSPEQLQSTVDSASPNLFMTNQGFNQNHPKLSGAIEGALGGLAFTHGSNTIGEGLSNVAQGMLNAKAARADKYNNQLMMPFEQAQQVANLKGISVDQQYKQAQSKRDEALVDHYTHMDDIHDFVAQGNAEHQKQIEGLQRQTHNLRLIDSVSKANFDTDDQAAYADIVKAGGGDPLDADPTAVANLLSNSQAKKTAADQAAKLKVAHVAATGRIAAAGAGAGAKPNAAAATDYRAEYGFANREMTQFNKDLASGMGKDDDGSFITGKSPKASAKRARIQARIDAAQRGMRQAETINTPGSGMTITPQPKIKTYDANTGKIQ